MRAGSSIRAVAVQVACGVVLAGAILVVAHFIAPNLLANLTAPPKLLDIDPPVYKCAAHAGETIQPVFSVRNVTDRDVKLLGAQTSCCCTTVNTKFPATLHPGETKQITLKANVESDAVGTFSRNAQLFVDRVGTVPTLTFEARLVPTNHEK
jgi:hypothetical protein